MSTKDSNIRHNWKLIRLRSCPQKIHTSRNTGNSSDRDHVHSGFPHPWLLDHDGQTALCQLVRMTDQLFFNELTLTSCSLKFHTKINLMTTCPTCSTSRWTHKYGRIFYIIDTFRNKSQTDWTTCKVCNFISSKFITTHHSHEFFLRTNMILRITQNSRSLITRPQFRNEHYDKEQRIRLCPSFMFDGL